ncbi:MAG: acetyl-CoA synthetase [Candidatus Aenigmarchaeota archaeon]|nr:acetyl-CoA synthetase [Candidatus Aenigmarchaeota archaeon]NIP40128.1 acetyl-CoA synthetase [Candidatus Aenigmarchaeota archaeon]NIQ18205.1 acetyl-CoA synthetase [Candidatus Aenigmarchaeota archaeon]NIS72962.1 acetyl-CoA synthetase [Candidatus Aenigmarchaeota archaeon]
MKLDQSECKKLTRKYGIPTAKEFLAKKPEQAIEFAKKIGYPVVMKIDSEDVVHKTETKTVVTNIKNKEEVLEAFEKIIRNAKKHKPKAKIRGVIVQEHVEGYETIVGGKIDPQFGPIILFGAGGIFTEVLKDVAIRICPIEKEDAEEMVGEVRYSKILKGFRGEPPVKINEITDILLRASKIMMKEKVKEMDINPLIVSHKGAKAVDVRIIK